MWDRSDKINVLSLKYKEIIATSIYKSKVHCRELLFDLYLNFENCIRNSKAFSNTKLNL